MPSDAFATFDYNVVDVDRLIANHAALSGTRAGRRGLGHITRSAVVMLCAAWELYVEQVLVECATHLAQRALPTDLPTDVQASLSDYVKTHKHQLKPLHLSGDGWRTVYIDSVREQAQRLNTPKSVRVDPLFLEHLGAPSLSTHWTIGATALDSFVTVRGEIAHRGRQAPYIPIGELVRYRNDVRWVAVDTDNHVVEHLKACCPGTRKAWRKTA